MLTRIRFHLENWQILFYLFSNFSSRMKFKITKQTFKVEVVISLFKQMYSNTKLCMMWFTLRDRNSLFFLLRERDEKKPLLTTARSFDQLSSTIRNE